MDNPFQQAYNLLFNYYGGQNWWPAESDFEVLVGAVLTQNTNWGNVEKALTVLKQRGLLTYERLSLLSVDEIAPLIRSSGYYNLKAARLRNLFNLIDSEYEGDFSLFQQAELYQLRQQLLSVKGIGPETADSILLYACHKPSFVVDAYTHRIFSRHNLVPEECDYHSLQESFTSSLDEDVALYNEYHALIVQVAKDFCKKKEPLCAGCPLEKLDT